LIRREKEEHHIDQLDFTRTLDSRKGAKDQGNVANDLIREGARLQPSLRKEAMRGSPKRPEGEDEGNNSKTSLAGLNMKDRL